MIAISVLALGEISGESLDLICMGMQTKNKAVTKVAKFKNSISQISLTIRILRKMRSIARAQNLMISVITFHFVIISSHDVHDIAFISDSSAVEMHIT